MADTGQNWFVQAFSRLAYHLAQQQESEMALGAMVRMADGGPGQAVHFDRLGTVTATARTARIAATPLSEPAHSRRRAVLQPYDLAVLVSDIDDVEMLLNPQSEYTKAIGYGMERTKDIVLLAALGGSAIEVATAFDADSAQTLTTQILPAGQVVASGADVFADLRAIKAKMDRAGVPRTDRFAVLAPEVEQALLGSTPVTSSDYQTVKALVDGDLTKQTYLGFRFVHSLQMTSTPPIPNYFWHKEALGLALARDTKFTVSDRADQNNATQVRANLVLGAVRIDDNAVVKYNYTPV
jgi:Phage capsid protein